MSICKRYVPGDKITVGDVVINVLRDKGGQITLEIATGGMPLKVERASAQKAPNQERTSEEKDSVRYDLRRPRARTHVMSQH